MKQIQTIILLFSIIMISSVGVVCASEAQILNPRIVHAIVSNPASIFGKTYPIQIDNKTYNVYYGFNVTYASVTNISIISDHNSIQIGLKDVTTDDAMWVQFPQNLVSSENNNFVLYVDGQEKRYELATSSDHSIVMGFMVPKNVQLVEIQGSRVIPEFPISATIAMMMAFTSVVLFSTLLRKK